MVAEENFFVPTNPSSRPVLDHLFFLLHNRCATIRQLNQVHAHISVRGFARKSFILVKLLSLYSDFHNVGIACKVFDRVPNRSCTLWNQIIRGHLAAGNHRNSVELFIQMERSDVQPDGHTYTYVTNGCTKGGYWGLGGQIHGKILKGGICSDIYVCTSLVDFYVKCCAGAFGGVQNAKKLFDEMPEKNAVTWNTLLLGFFRQGDVDGARGVFNEMPWRNTVSWTTMIVGCAQNGRSKEALAFFRMMVLENIEFDQVTLVGVLSACAELGDLRLGKWVHSYVLQSFVNKTQLLISLQNSLIHMYASCGEINAAFDIFRSMKQRTTVSWTSMITAFAKHGYGDVAISMFQSMLQEGRSAKPDAITFLGVLCACSHSGYVEMGWHYFNSMVENWGIDPKIEHFGCMVDMLSRAGLLDDAHRVVKSMRLKPNDVIWGALLGGCRIHRSVKLASDVLLSDWFCQELQVDDRASGYFALLSNVYAGARKWHDVAAVRQKMINKPPGRSWIQTGEEVTTL